ncbi:NACHT, LRR and PYD domains-containing protein 12-like [Echeneis naucrates]|uniref:NACHT, LRR and PYD domains-containing protein 12-like n=1 Tax=Echeneis naucrates TaxID=173247 RepID=A0A665V960_ECHNA|nr:NACHT, LRR and PYD domains-containing protein 12-like [Echeneis naucrates]
MPASVMDLQTVFKTTLKNKFKKLNETHAENSLLPPRLSYWDAQHNFGSLHLHHHEFRHVDKSNFHTWVVFPSVPLADILSCDCKHHSSKRTVITLGVCGIGKTTAVQNCAIDWAEERGYHDIHLLLPLTFWELNLIKCRLSIVELLQTFYPELGELSAFSLNEKNVWFVLDGLDESSLQLQFSSPAVSDVSEVSTVDVLVTSLIKGTLLPKAHVWITTRFAAAAQIPHAYLLKQTMMQGFSDEQKVQHFRRIICNDDLANKVMNHVRISRSLNFLCQIPPICTILATVLKGHLEAQEGFKINPLSLTQIYTHLIKPLNSDIIVKLKKMALLRMEEGNVMYEQDLSESDITAEEASMLSRECPLVLATEKGLHDTTVFRFGHSSIREFLAASAKIDEMELDSFPDACIDLVDEVMLNAEGKFDVFLRFIFGLIKERHILEPSDTLFHYIKMMILENITADITSYQAESLFHCLREYDSQAFKSEVKLSQKLFFCPFHQYSLMVWNIMSKMVSTFEGITESFEMQLSTRCDEILLTKLPAILKSRKAMLRFSNLTDKCCPALADVLSTRESYLRELDLGYNNITDDGVRELVKGLNDQNCRLKILRLQGCGVTSKACKYLATSLTQSLKLRELDLCGNEIGNEGLQHLSSGLRSCECQLEKLKLSQCNIEQKGCYYLASALQKNSSHLTLLDLSINMVGDEGANELFAKFDISKLRKLELYHCNLTALSCESIGEALKSETSTLVELNLSSNNLKDAGFALICQGMYAWSSLKKLNVSRCGITRRGCFYLAKVLCSVSQLYNGFTPKTEVQAVELTELDLSMNYLRDEGVIEISDGLKNPYSHLKSLNLSYCGLTDECCAALASGFAFQQSIISELDLSSNDLQDKGVKKLCIGLKSYNCKLTKLSLRTCGLSSRSIQFLTTALKSNSQHLGVLHLMGNSLDDSAIRELVALTQDQKYSLHTIDVSAD